MKRAIAITLGLGLLSAQTALAQKAPKPKPTPAPAPAPSPSKPDVSALETSGNKHFELAEYDAAIADFKEAFRISDEPAFLYNIAQAYRLARDCREAATFYKTYLRRVPDAPNAAKIRERITEMEACAATQPVTPPPTNTNTNTNTTTTPPPPLEPPPDEVPVDDPPPANDRAWMKWSGIAGIGVGAIGLGLAVKFGLDGKAADDELADKCSISCSSSVALALEEDGKAANRNMVIFGVAGGAVLAAGVVLFVLSRGGSSSSEKPSVALSITPESAGATYGWSF
ncbi:MAG: tetratricopeptide repeat protein [Kofleriaceae bacterium]